jgi:serine/threonine protein kinase
MFDLLFLRSEELGSDRTKHVLRQLSDALSHLHDSLHMVHADVKLENVLVRSLSPIQVRALEGTRWYSSYAGVRRGVLAALLCLASRTTRRLSHGCSPNPACAPQIVLADVDGGTSLGRATAHVRWHALRASARVRECQCCAGACVRACSAVLVRVFAGTRACLSAFLSVCV